MNLKQIEEKINEKFQRFRLVFWFDDQGAFKDDIEDLNLDGKVHYLTKTNSFRTKVLLEREDRESKYLLYADFPFPGLRDYHLADTISYSETFYADRISLLVAELGLDEGDREVLGAHANFFNAQDRTKKFSSYELAEPKDESIRLAMMASLAGTDQASLEAIIRRLLGAEDLRENKYLDDFAKYGLVEYFWLYLDDYYGFKDPEPNLVKLAISLFVTYGQSMTGYLPDRLRPYLMTKPGSVKTLMDQLVDSVEFKEDFDRLSARVYQAIDGDKLYDQLAIDEILDLDIFEETERRIMAWIRDGLINQELEKMAGGMDIAQICWDRETRHFGKSYINEYHMLRHGYEFLFLARNLGPGPYSSTVESYCQEGYRLDYHYRKYYFYLDRLDSKIEFDQLTQLVENTYLNKALPALTIPFVKNFSYMDLREDYKMQKDFYNNYIRDRENLVVIISDAFRYEVAKELEDNIHKDKDMDVVQMEVQIGLVPSKTNLAMAGLLPHRSLEYDYYNDKVFIDGEEVRPGLRSREAILRGRRPEARAFQYDDLVGMTRDEQREAFRDVRLAYIYHDAIDARGDQESTEDEVFAACAQAIEEIHKLIRTLTGNVSRTSYLITADHGFIYKRTGLAESDKIDFEKLDPARDRVHRRFAISSKDQEIRGVRKVRGEEVYGGYLHENIYFPESHNVFKARSDGAKFNHGGISPQEILVPVLEVRSIKGKVEARPVGLKMMSTVDSIFTLNFDLEFIQDEPISDRVLPAEYRLVFVDEGGQPVSNEQRVRLESKAVDTRDRIFSLSFSLRDQVYYPDEVYYLLAENLETGNQALKKEMSLDIGL